MRRNPVDEVDLILQAWAACRLPHVSGRRRKARNTTTSILLIRKESKDEPLPRPRTRIRIEIRHCELVPIVEGMSGRIMNGFHRFFRREGMMKALAHP